MGQNIIYRIASERDGKELLEIYRPYVEKTAISFEYEVPTEEEFRNRIRCTLKRYPYIVAESEGELLGYVYASPFVRRAAYDWCAETSIYVKENKKGLGIGKGLYEQLERYLKRQNILNVNACIASVDEEDEHLTNASIHFHGHMGYRMVGKFEKCGYKFGRWYDMVWMEKMLGEHLAFPKPVLPFPEIADKTE